MVAHQEPPVRRTVIVRNRKKRSKVQREAEINAAREEEAREALLQLANGSTSETIDFPPALPDDEDEDLLHAGAPPTKRRPALL